MKRNLLLLGAAGILLLSAVGCGSSEKTKDVALSSVTATMEAYEKGSYVTQSIGDLKTLYNIDSGDVKQFVARTKDDTVAIVMLETTSGDAANRITDTLQTYLDDKGLSGQVVHHGNYVAMFAGTSSAEKMAEDFSQFVLDE
jgi:hypothetical protein